MVPADVMPDGYPRVVQHKELVLVVTDLDTRDVRFEPVQPAYDISVVARDATPPTPTIAGMVEYTPVGRGLRAETLEHRTGKALKPGSGAARRYTAKSKGRRGKSPYPIWGPPRPSSRRRR